MYGNAQLLPSGKRAKPSTKESKVRRAAGVLALAVAPALPKIPAYSTRVRHAVAVAGEAERDGRASGQGGGDG